MPQITLNLEKQKQYITHKGKRYLINIELIDKDFCACGCGEKAVQNSKYFNSACRKRVSRANSYNHKKIKKG